MIVPEIHTVKKCIVKDYLGEQKQVGGLLADNFSHTFNTKNFFSVSLTILVYQKYRVMREMLIEKSIYTRKLHYKEIKLMQNTTIILSRRLELRSRAKVKQKSASVETKPL